MSLREICQAHTSLTAEDIALLEGVESALPHVADLTGCDVFIDCMAYGTHTALVAAEAKPAGDLSAYGRAVLGQMALRENEPAVYHAFETGLVIRDLKAITQENVVVRQDVAPIKNTAGAVVGVLIKEKDVSRALRRERKYEELSREREEWPQAPEGASCPPQADSLTLRETHHRVKNSLQLVASMLNIQARRPDLQQHAQIFRDCVGKVLSIAAVHDMLTKSGDDWIRLKRLLEQICQAIGNIQGEDGKVALLVKGDEIAIPAGKASSVAMVVHELVFNALEHSFAPGEEGRIVISLREGSRYSSVVVEDNGAGFDPSSVQGGGTGFNLVSLMVRDKLGGELQFSTGPGGTKAMFDFQN